MFGFGQVTQLSWQLIQFFLSMTHIVGEQTQWIEISAIMFAMDAITQNKCAINLQIDA
ncbi:hypothetical protein BpOF4_18635 [Alkalihalophilus pseudofirmus OF4]|uniref:Uncharacterized protein n=1 Tax=Alkalihalophilus pseudofirmus (strain ATCC BAA-2126 / JCM 17055 / OF4) TaxID=398511 RepID=D3FSQ3_ALKPO|nr:hypothetical protein BpOF4_18635 [Alkalihalophilus pseudofirmus OF4]